MNSTNRLTIPSSTTVSLDGFSDLVANKMVTLVERGAAQDFLDIYTLCYEGLTTASQCWQLWKLRQESTDYTAKTVWAKTTVLNHIAHLTKKHSLEQVSDPIECSAQSHICMWFQTDFLDAL